MSQIEIECENTECSSIAQIEIDKHIFCSPCYEKYYYKQKSGCLDWRPIK